MLAPVRPRRAPDAPVAIVGDDAAVRERLSDHLSGLALAPTMMALAEQGVLRAIRTATDVSAGSLAHQTRANPARLRVALRLLASCGWLDEQRGADPRHCFFRLTPAGRAAFDAPPHLFRQATSALAALAHLPQQFSAAEDGLAPVLRELTALRTSGWGLGDLVEPAAAEQIRRHLDGILAVAAIVTLARAGILELLAQGPLRLLDVDELLEVLFDTLAAEGWLVRNGSDTELTAAGEQVARMAPVCCEIWSYAPLLASLPIRLFETDEVGEADVVVSIDEALNVAGRGGAYQPWAAPLERLIVDLFNRPIAQQPRGICDVSCGSGALLEHLYRLVKVSTVRGRLLKEHPLLLVGVDTSRVARDIAGRTLRAASLARCHIVAGDVDHPAAIAEDAARHQMSLRDLLHVSVFAQRQTAGSDEPAGAGPNGLVAHFERWQPFASRFGLAVFERHPLQARSVGDQHASAAYEAVRGYGGGCLHNQSAVIEAARHAGLDRHPLLQAQFPEPDRSTVSFSYLTVAGRPQP